MELKTLPTRRGVSETTRRDFVIEGAAELGACLGAQALRATLRNLPRLLPATIRQGIADLLHAIERATAPVGSSSAGRLHS